MSRIQRTESAALTSVEKHSRHFALELGEIKIKNQTLVFNSSIQQTYR